METKHTPNEVKQKLTEAGIKATQQRIVIYACLLSSDEHPTADAIYEMIKTENPSISLATVYKTLDNFAECGILKRVKTGQDVYRFDAKLHNHNHLHDVRTNKIMDFEDEELDALLQNYFEGKKIKDFKINDFQLQINGEIQN